MNLCSPNLTVNPDTSVTTKTASTSQPQPLVAIPNPSAVTAAPASPNTAMCDARYP